MKADRVVVVVAYGRADLIGGCLAALDPDEQVLVVDNSQDERIRAVADRAGATYLDAGHNRGFGGGVNVALAHIAAARLDGDVLLLNPDAVIDSRGIDALQKALHADPALGAVAPELVGPESAAGPQVVAWPYPSPRRMWIEALGLHRIAAHLAARFAVRLPARQQVRRTADGAGFVVGAVVLLRRLTVDQVGGFDERFFLYAEETDWQRRARALGWRSTVVGAVRAEHIGAATSPDSAERDARFHAAQETYIRRWFGARGWASYRAAATVGALGRAGALRGPRRAQALARARLYARGPARTAPLPPAGRPLRITHVVVTANLAGTERYVADLARAQAADGHHVSVVGGDPRRMPAVLGPHVAWRPGARIPAAWWAVRAEGQRDVVHTHLTNADLVGAASGLWHGARLVSTRHFAAHRGRTVAVRLAAALLQQRIDAEISISEFVSAGIGRMSTVVRTGLAPATGTAPLTSTRIVVLQRLEAEKRTDIALAGWERSGLAERGFTLVIAGAGALRADLQAAHPGPGIEWTGWVDDPTALLHGAAALLASAPAEPFGLSVLEAMRLGLPVVAAAGGGHLETVGAVQDALLFRPDDAADCARALQAFADLDPAARCDYGARLQRYQREHLTSARMLSAVDAVYRHGPLSHTSDDS